MEKEMSQLIDESIKLELNVASLYLVFYDLFPADADFWWQLILEEKNHATLIRGARDAFISPVLFPREMLAPNLKTLEEANNNLTAIIEQYKKKPPTRLEAFNTAVEVEESAGEIHFQKAMTNTAKTDIMEVFQKLNNDDKDHADRIRAYMKEKKIK